MSIFLKPLPLLSLFFFTYCLTNPNVFGNSRVRETPVIVIYNGGGEENGADKYDEGEYIEVGGNWFLRIQVYRPCT
ncbi:hypothetical protein ACFX19_017130 [Malus domestica]